MNSKLIRILLILLLLIITIFYHLVLIIIFIPMLIASIFLNNTKSSRLLDFCKNSIAEIPDPEDDI